MVKDEVNHAGGGQAGDEPSAGNRHFVGLFGPRQLLEGLTGVCHFNSIKPLASPTNGWKKETDGRGRELNSCWI